MISLFDQPLKVGQSRNQRTTIGGGQHPCWWRKLFITKSIQFWQRLQFIKINIPQQLLAFFMSDRATNFGIWLSVYCLVFIHTHPSEYFNWNKPCEHCDQINSLFNSIEENSFLGHIHRYENMLRTNLSHTQGKYTDYLGLFYVPFCVPFCTKTR